MVCSCGNRCGCTCLVCHGRKICNRGLSPACNVTLVDTKDEIKFCQCFQSEIKITGTCFTTTLLSAKGSTITSAGKPKNCESSDDSVTPLSSTSYNSSLNDSQLLISENEHKKLSVQKTSRFGSLKLTLRKMKFRFKKLKNRKNNYSLLSAEGGHEASGESSVETISTDEVDFSPSKRTESLKINGCSTENLLPPLPKSENILFTTSQVDQNAEKNTQTKSSTTSTEADVIKKQHGGNQSISYPEDSSHFPEPCSTSPSIKLKWSKAQNTHGETNLYFDLSDLNEDFETRGVRSSPDCIDTESVSSSEFLPCSYCRFVTLSPLTSDSVIPYETLE